MDLLFYEFHSKIRTAINRGLSKVTAVEKLSVMLRFVKKLLFKERNEKQVISVVLEINERQKYLTAKLIKISRSHNSNLISQEISKSYRFVFKTVSL